MGANADAVSGGLASRASCCHRAAVSALVWLRAAEQSDYQCLDRLLSDSDQHDCRTAKCARRTARYDALASGDTLADLLEAGGACRDAGPSGRAENRCDALGDRRGRWRTGWLER